VTHIPSALLHRFNQLSGAWTIFFHTTHIGEHLALGKENHWRLDEPFLNRLTEIQLNHHREAEALHNTFNQQNPSKKFGTTAESAETC
jgi:hypothetical protein